MLSPVAVNAQDRVCTEAVDSLESDSGVMDILGAEIGGPRVEDLAEECLHGKRCQDGVAAVERDVVRIAPKNASTSTNDVEKMGVTAID